LKTYFLLFLLIITTVLFQTISYGQSSATQLDYYKSNPNDLKDANGNSILNNPIESDSLLMTGEATGDNMGNSVSSAGDVNGDGYSDVIVGAPGYSSSKGRAYIFYGGELMDNISDVTMTGLSNNNFFGNSVSSAGDVNGDGYSEVIVGAYGYSSMTGRAYIFYGGSSMNNVADVTMTGQTSNHFGWSVSTSGDVNGDGYSDVIVGAFGSSVTGRAYIYYGGTNMNNVADVTMTGQTSDTYFGWSVSTAGDVNGDGKQDVIVGAFGYSSSKGRAYIFYGGSSMDNIADVTMTGEAMGNDFGNSVSTAGDVNGDGYSDVIVGAYSYYYQVEKGRAYIYYGGTNMNNVADVIMTGEATNDKLGRSVSTAGDVNGDSYSDVIIGAFGYNSITGRAYIFYGGSSMDNIADVTMTGETTDNYFGFSVSSAGDVNGDGKPDVIVGAFGYNFQKGRAYLYINVIPRPELINPSNNSINNSTTINFKWRILTSALYYVLIVSRDSIFNNIIVNDTIFIDTFKTVSGLQKDTKYYWRVRAKDTSGVTYHSSKWNFTTIPPIYLSLKVLTEGMYFPIFNQMTRKDTVKVFLRNVTSPYAIVDSAKGTIDSLSFSGMFNFVNETSGTYYLVVKHFNCIETWSKAGGESLVANGSIFNYDFTSAITQAYGNNLKLKGSKYTIYSGDINQDGIVDGSDLIRIHTDAFNFVTGIRIPTDLNGDNVVDGSDYSIGDNNGFNYVVVIRP